MRNLTGRKQEPLADGWRGIIEPDGTLKLHNGAVSIDRATIVVRIPPAAAIALGLWLLRTILTKPPPPEPEPEPPTIEFRKRQPLNFEPETDEPDSGDDGGGSRDVSQGGALQPALPADRE